MTYNQFIGLPLDEALQSCAMQGIEPCVLETRSPKHKEDATRSPRVVAVRGRDENPCFVVAFFSEKGPEDA